MITVPQVQNSTLLNKGKIYLIRTPVNGRYGILRLYNMMVSNQLGFEWEPDEEVCEYLMHRDLPIRTKGSGCF